jgi:hypothetical protein
MRNSGLMVMFVAAPPPVVPARVSAVYPAPGVKVSPTGPSTPMAPISSSSACVVGAVAAVVGAALLPVPVAVRSSVAVAASPENSLALIARATTVG